jgi:hypothetical protein
MSSSVTGLFFPVLLLKQWYFPPFKVQVSDCITICIMCDFQSSVVFLSEYIEVSPDVAFKFFFKPFCYYSDGSN